MLLVLTNSEDTTADYLLNRLSECGMPFVRFDTDNAIERMRISYSPGEPLLTIDGIPYSPCSFSNIWYRRPERLISKLIPETPEGKCVLDEWSESLEGFFAHIPKERWMNFPAANALASRKLEQLTAARTFGLAIPETLVTQDARTLKEFFNRHDGKLIVKPMGRAYIDRSPKGCDSLIFTNAVSSTDLTDLSDLEKCPTLFQQSIQKIADIRITIVDSVIHAFELKAQDSDGRQRCDIRRNNMIDVQYSSIQLPNHVAVALRNMVDSYQLRFAAIDMAISTDGTWVFFEINPNGQWAWLDLYAGASIHQSFMRSFSQSAS